MSKFKEPGFQTRAKQRMAAKFGVQSEQVKQLPPPKYDWRGRMVNFMEVNEAAKGLQMFNMNALGLGLGHATLLKNPCMEVPMPRRIRAANRWNGVYDYPRPKGTWQDQFKDVQEYKDRLQQRGFEYLGGGAFSTVYGKPGCPQVVKVCHAGDTDPWPLFAAWAHANPSPYLPVIHSFKRHKGFYVAVIERLDMVVSNAPKGSGHKQAVNLFRDFVEGNETSPVTEAVFGLYPGIEGVLTAMRQEFRKKARWDLHKGNWMLRADTLVITDPICEGHSSSSTVHTVKRIKGSKARIAA